MLDRQTTKILLDPFQILIKQETTGWQWHQLDHMQIICTLLQTFIHTITKAVCSSAAQPTVSKY